MSIFQKTNDRWENIKFTITTIVTLVFGISTIVISYNQGRLAQETENLAVEQKNIALETKNIAQQQKEISIQQGDVAYEAKVNNDLYIINNIIPNQKHVIDTIGVELGYVMNNNKKLNEEIYESLLENGSDKNKSFISRLLTIVKDYDRSALLVKYINRDFQIFNDLCRQEFIGINKLLTRNFNDRRIITYLKLKNINASTLLEYFTITQNNKKFAMNFLEVYNDIIMQ
jgi:hypothetical protein